jgi:hypothetical protein
MRFDDVKFYPQFYFWKPVQTGISIDHSKFAHFFSCFIKTRSISSKQISQATYYASGPPIPRSQRVYVDREGGYYKFLKTPSFLKPPERIVGEPARRVSMSPAIPGTSRI